MKNSVFISGSIDIKTLPNTVKASIDSICQQKMSIVVGDARGVDTLVQEYCQQYNLLTVYYIGEQPRNISSRNFKIKKITVPNTLKGERERQQEKDNAMTNDTEYSLIIWNGKSKGSYSNIIRAIEKNKRVKVYLTTENDYLPEDKISNNEIDFIYRENVGYSVEELVDILGKDQFNTTRKLYKYLTDKKILKKEEGGAYTPQQGYDKLFYIQKYRGKITGIRCKNELIDLIEKDTKSQGSLF